MHTDPVVEILFTLVLVLVAAKVGGEVAQRLRQPAVLGELLAGVVMGNLSLAGIHRLEFMKHDPAIELLAGLGVVLLLFDVGLESTVGEMMKVGGSSFLVATIGVVVPSLLGWGVGAWLLPEASVYAHAFLGATLCATSVGITARVLQDLGRSRDIEARIVLGAAVLDDVMGLVVLAVVAGVITAVSSGTALSIGAIFWIVAKAMLFLVGSLLLGSRIAPGLFKAASYLRSRGVLLAAALSVCFLLSAIAGKMGLAPIVGAFAAGLLLEEIHFKDFDRGLHGLKEQTTPLVGLLAPFFFVQMGLRVDLATFGGGSVLILAAVLTVAAIIGKQACSLGVLERGANRLAVGIGMIPRGEVGLIFAQIGQSLKIGEEHVIDNSTYSAVVIMVIVTTVVTPGALKWALGRTRAAGAGPAAA